MSSVRFSFSIVTGLYICGNTWQGQFWLWPCLIICPVSLCSLHASPIGAFSIGVYDTASSVQSQRSCTLAGMPILFTLIKSSKLLSSVKKIADLDFVFENISVIPIEYWKYKFR